MVLEQMDNHMENNKPHPYLPSYKETNSKNF